MHFKILIGKKPYENIINYNDNFKDDIQETIGEMTLLLLSNNITINNPSQFLIFQASTMLLRNIVNSKELITLPSLNPSNVRIVKIDENNLETDMLKDGLLSGNYFNDLMKEIMDGYYDALIYYK